MASSNKKKKKQNETNLFKLDSELTSLNLLSLNLWERTTWLDYALFLIEKFIATRAVGEITLETADET